MRSIVSWRQRTIAVATATCVIGTQVVMPPCAEASHLGSSTVSAGSAPPPAATVVQSFQPDLFTGRAGTSIPIAVPPGRKGVQPSLALTYSSASRNGWLGVGWNLDVGYIERSTRRGVPTYDDSRDPFSFLFQGVNSELTRLLDGTYRAKQEGLFLRFQFNGASGWEVRDKSGVRYFFGQSPSARIENSGRTFRWCLEKVLDLNGNSLAITYTTDQGQIYPAQIRYTAHEPTNLAPSNQVDFILEARTDIETTFQPGFAVATAKRLEAIETKATVNGSLALARRYELAYTQSARTGRSLLTSVTPVGADGTTRLSQTTFTYQDGGRPTYTLRTNSTAAPPIAWNLRNANRDTGHNNFGCVQPYSSLPWNSPVVASGSGTLGNLTYSVGSNGSLSVSGPQDAFVHAYVFVYVGTARTITIPLSSGGDVEACLYREDASGVQQMAGWTGNVPLQAGWSLLHMTAYHQHQGWSLSMTSSLTSQVDIMSPSNFNEPQLTGDVDGNGTTDLITFDPSRGAWTVSCAQTCTLSPGGIWLTGFGDAAQLPLLGDWNGDGKTDIAIFKTESWGGHWQFATSTGTAFQLNTIVSQAVGRGIPLTGDFNGDGLTDIGTDDNGTWSVALAQGTWFQTAGSFSRLWGSGGDTPLTGDFNGDGLTDIAIGQGGTVQVALSNGAAFVPQPQPWITGFGSEGYTTADFNGDGLTDLVYYDRSAGQVVYAPSIGSGFSAPQSLPVTFSLRSKADQLQVGDFNGDGLSDPAVFNLLGSSELTTSQGSLPDLLTEIRNGIGGTTTISYQLSTQLGSALPLIAPVVSRVTADDGLGNQYTTTYAYSGGLYDPPTREFRGFALVEVRDPEGNVAATEFYQDQDLKGRPFRVKFSDAAGRLWTKQEHEWRWRCGDSCETRFVFLAKTDTFTYDGDDTFKQTETQFAYYDSTLGQFRFGWYDRFGNPTQINDMGDVNVIGDERHTFNHYAVNDTEWIVDRLAHTKIITSMLVSGRTVREQWFYYDGRLPSPTERLRLNDIVDTTPPTKGLLTGAIEYWDTNAPEGDPNPLTQFTYDVYGNVATTVDALGRTTTNTYDSTGTYLVQITNALGHTRQMTYDPRFGQATSTTDASGVTTTTECDAFGRVTKVIGPNDSAALPTVSYTYDLSKVPTKTVVQARVQSGQPEVLATSTFADGLGRTIQTRSPAQDPTKQVVTGTVEFNARGLVSRQWTPYLAASATDYVPSSSVPGLSPPAAYVYDPLGRVTDVTDPDGSITTTAYDDARVTVTDAKGHKTRRTADAYGRVVQVEEFNGAEVYTTKYTYGRFSYPNGLLDELTQVTDAAGNVTVLDYDTLGRKIRMSDPDMGKWTYAYDALNNLLEQVDNRGVKTTFTYDMLNRLTRKDYAGPPGSGIPLPAPVIYTYDDPATPYSKGKLSSIQDGSGTSSFTYDRLGRLVTEEKTIDGTTYTITRSYDLLGRLTSLAYPGGEIATYTYNRQGGIQTIRLQPVTGSVQPIVTGMDYNAAGQITKIGYGNGVVTDYTYNPQTLQLSSSITQHPASGVLQDFRYSFDAVGNVSAITDRVHTGTQSFQYDDLNRLTQAVGLAYGTRTYAYDSIGNMIQKDGVGLRYDKVRELVDSMTGYQWVKPHVATSSSDGLDYVYDRNGNLTRKVNQASGVAVSELSYDGENRLSQVVTGSVPSQTATVALVAGWNFFSLPVVPSDRSIAGILGANLSAVKQVSRFDPQTQAFEHFVNDPAFDQFEMLEAGRGYAVYLSAPVTLSLTGSAPAAGTTVGLLPTFTLIGNPTARTITVAQLLNSLSLGVNVSSLRRYTGAGFTALSQSDTVRVGEGVFAEPSAARQWVLPTDGQVTTRFVYDGDGGRVKQTTASGTTTFLGESYEVGPDGTTTTSVFAGSQRIAAVTQSPQPSAPSIRFYHTDHLGSSNVITDGTGKLVELTEYTPYGSLASAQSPQPSAPSPFKFTGQRLDASTGLYFYHARYYDPQLGRFIQADPVVPSPGDPQALNRYSYVRNNPLKYTDPSGHGWFQQFWRTIVGVAAAAVSIMAPPLAPAMWAVNIGISAATAIQTGNVAGFAGGIIGGAIFGAIGQGFGLGMATSMGQSAYTFLGGAIAGAAEFGAAGFGSGFGAALASGAGFRDSFRAGGAGAAAGAVMGAAIQGSYMAGWQNSAHGLTAGAVANTQGYDPSIQDLVNTSPRVRAKFRQIDIYRHYSYGDEEAFLAGGLRIGTFVTKDVYTSGLVAQQMLALPPKRMGDLPPNAYYNVIVDVGKVTRSTPVTQRTFPPSAYAPNGAYRTGGGTEAQTTGPTLSVIYGGSLTP